MEKIEIILDNYLFNSGILGFYKIIQNVDKEYLVEEKGNTLEVDIKVFDDFEKDYIKTMLDLLGNDTRWFSITESIEKIEDLDISDEKNVKILDEQYKIVKKALESNSYKAGFQIAKANDEEDPYEYLEKIKKEKGPEIKKQYLIKIIEYLKKHKEIYCMKDIMYNKINMFWTNVAFLYKKAKDKDIEGEYKKTFVTPVKEYLESKKKSEYNCIECLSPVIKSKASGMAWLIDTGVDYKKKNSGFWNFKEDAFLCPICNLIYSCVPLGFYTVGKNSIFINQNDNIELLRKENAQIEIYIQKTKNSLENAEQGIFMELLKTFENTSNKKYAEKQVQNIEVIKRKTDGNKVFHEFNIVSKEKIEIFQRNKNQFEMLVGKRIYIKDEYINIYEEVINNFLCNKNQYKLLDNLIIADLENTKGTSYKKCILDIQIDSMGGMKMEEKMEIEELIKKTLDAGIKLKKTYLTKERANKFKTYILQLSNSLRTNNPELFMDILTRMYGSIGENIPNADAFVKMIVDVKYFRSLGYAYIVGLQA